MAETNVIASSLCGIGNASAQVIIALHECIADTEQRPMIVSDLARIPDSMIQPQTLKINFQSRLICFNDELLPPHHTDIQIAFPGMFSEEEMVADDEKGMHELQIF